MLNDINKYKYRRVFISIDWFVKVRGLWADDPFELAELLKTLNHNHDWPVLRIVFVNAKEEVQSALDSIGLATYKRYLEIRSGSHNPDVSVTSWEEDILE